MNVKIDEIKTEVKEVNKQNDEIKAEMKKQNEDLKKQIEMKDKELKEMLERVVWSNQVAG